MSATIRVCPSCKTTLPSDAIFCHKCGKSTPMEIDAATGEIHAPELSGLEEQARRAKLQAAVGDTIEVRRLLGRGGFAEVYVAYDKRLKREIAVKTIRGDLVVNDTLLQRFQREAEAVAKLRHPHVIPIYSVGEESGIAYFTMPLIEGESLADLLDREGRLSVAEGCRILREAANALHAAHRAGLVHRDIKPENIMLEGPERTAVVMDFGIAKSDGPESKGLTGTGMLVGTPQYMSPEQATGDRALDARSDQYSLAMVGYRMLTGRFPFTGDSVQQLIFKTVTEVPVAASDLSSDIPKDVSNVLARALAKAPEERYESMAAFAAAISATDRDAEGARGVRGFRRPEPDMGTRISQALQALPRWKHPLVPLAVVGLAIAFVVQARTRTKVGTAIAAHRADAVFAAKAFLTQRGVAVTSSAYPDFEERKRTREFLMEKVGPDSTDRRAAADIPVWLWKVRFGESSAGKWTVFVANDNRIVEYNKVVSDTAQLPSLTRDSARVIAEREVRAMGWRPETMRLVTDSTITRKRRVDHFFRWQRTDNAIPWRGADSAFQQVATTVRGDQVVDFDTILRLPDSYDTFHAKSPIWKILAAIGWATVVIMCAFAFGFGVTRQRIDQLQWSVMLRIFAGCVVLLGLIVVPMLIQSLALNGGGNDMIAMLIFFPIMIATVGSALLFAAVVGESFAREMRPQWVQGLEDVSRGRFAIPEVMSGIFWGYLMGFVAAGVAGIAKMVAWRGLKVWSIPGEVPPQFGFALPGASALGIFSAGIILALIILYGVTFFARMKMTSRAAVILPAVIATALFATTPSSAVSLGVAALFFSATFWYFGAIAVAFASWAPDVIKDSIALMGSGSSEFVTAGVVNLAVALAPLVFAFVLLRRYRRAQ